MTAAARSPVAEPVAGSEPAGPDPVTEPAAGRGPVQTEPARADPAMSDSPAPPAEDPAALAASLSTQPAPVESRRFAGWAGPPRRSWRRLTSMRTALVLLFLLALAAVPGSLLPQRSLNPTKVDQYLVRHPTLGPLLDRLGFFGVFGTPWFAAIYLLLFVSLVGCLIPRIRLHLRALRGQPPPAPRNLHRLPASAGYSCPAGPEQVAAGAAAALRGWRVTTRPEPGGVLTVSAEKGYLRETGNLLFHVSLTLLLVGVAVGRLWGYQGTVLVEEGSGFCNSVSLYDSFRPGRFVTGTNLAPFCVDSLDKFTASYDQDGTPSLFRADIRYSLGSAGSPRRYPLEVNKPLRIDGVRVYLVSHGFSPRFTVRTPSGQEFRDISAPFLPQNGQLLSEGAVKLPDARPHQLAIYGLFAPTAVAIGNGVISSGSAQPQAPAVAIVVYRGDLGADSGRPQSVYTVDQGQIDRGALTDVARANLVPGEGIRLPDGTSVLFDGYKQWATLQVNRDPGQQLVFGAAVVLVLGLLLSLSVRRRRLWLRITPASGEPTGATAGRGGASGDPTADAVGADRADGGPGSTDPAGGRTVVAVGALARTDAGGFPAEFARIVARLENRTSTRKD